MKLDEVLATHKNPGGFLLSRIEAKDWEKLLEVLDSQLKKMCKIRLGASNYRPKTGGEDAPFWGKGAGDAKSSKIFIEVYLVLLYGRALE